MDLRCQYKSAYCPNKRSLKIGGDLHRLCLFHRTNANAAQRRWKEKKRQLNRSSGLQGDDLLSESDDGREQFVSQEATHSLPPRMLSWLDNQNPLEFPTGVSDLTPEDLAILESLMVNEEEELDFEDIPRNERWWDLSAMKGGEI